MYSCCYICVLSLFDLCLGFGLLGLGLLDDELLIVLGGQLSLLLLGLIRPEGVLDVNIPLFALEFAGIDAELGVLEDSE